MSVAQALQRERGLAAVARDYLSLLKLRVVLLLDATAVGVMVPAAHGHPRVGSVLAVTKGDEVIYGRYAGTDVEVEGREVKILREGDILAKVVK